MLIMPGESGDKCHRQVSGQSHEWFGEKRQKTQKCEGQTDKQIDGQINGQMDNAVPTLLAGNNKSLGQMIHQWLMDFPH